jgi:hypothetical protein
LRYSAAILVDMLYLDLAPPLSLRFVLEDAEMRKCVNQTIIVNYVSGAAKPKQSIKKY